MKILSRFTSFVTLYVSVAIFLPLFTKGDEDCKSIAEIACATNGFNILCQAIEKLNLYDELDRIESTEFTVFAPGDSAFRDVLYDYLRYEDVHHVPLDVLERIILTHVYDDGKMYEVELKDRCGQLLTMANNEITRTVCEDSARQIFQKGRGNVDEDRPEIVTTDIEACNGIIHVVDKIILPSNLPAKPTFSPTTTYSPSSTFAPTRMGGLRPAVTRRPTGRPTRRPDSSPTTREPTRRPTRKPTRKPFADAVTDASCSANPICRRDGLTGDCCPAPNGEYLECCERLINQSCLSNPICRQDGLTGDCCPTKEGDFLGCCDVSKRPTPSPTRKPTDAVSDASCSANPICRRDGLTGDCCPAPNGEYLECCERLINQSCLSNPICRQDGLTGDCCPTKQGDFLGCCDVSKRPTPSPTRKPTVDEGTCSTAPICKRNGLTGECCPTEEGVYLDCCVEKPFGSCSSNRNCREIGLRGECCPTTNGEFLDCCSDEPPLVGTSYCTYSPDYNCYVAGWPECCGDKSLVCPSERPPCEIGFPIVGDDYCTYSPDTNCYVSGWPECCQDNSLECPSERPPCEIGFPIVGDDYCTYSPDRKCYKDGRPSCCFENDGKDCPSRRPSCNVPCDSENSLSTIKDFICGNARLEFLCYALNLDELSDIDYMLDSNGAFTVFAPTDNAFDRLGEDAIRFLFEDGARRLQDVLLYHITSNYLYYYDDLTCDTMIDTTLRTNNNDFKTTTKCYNNDNAKRYQVGYGNDESETDKLPLIVDYDNIKCNGVVHLVDNVILPLNP